MLDLLLFYLSPAAAVLAGDTLLGAFPSCLLLFLLLRDTHGPSAHQIVSIFETGFHPLRARKLLSEDAGSCSIVHDVRYDDIIRSQDKSTERRCSGSHVLRNVIFCFRKRMLSVFLD